MPVDWEIGVKAKDVFRNSSVKHQGKDLTVLSATQDRGIVPRSEVDIDIKYDEGNIDSYKKVEKGDFVISLRSFQGGIELSNYEGVVSPAYTILKNKKPIDIGYYKTYFKTTDFVNRLNSAVYGIRDGKQIGYEDFGDLIIHYPPLEEQKKIAQILAACDRVIELKQKLVDELKKLKKVCLAKMFPQEGETVPEIRFPSFTEHWEKRRLEDVTIEFRSGVFIAASEIEKVGSYPVYGGNGLRGYTERFNHDGEFVLIGRQGALCGNVNYSTGKAYFTEHAVAVKANASADTRFLFYILGKMNLGQYSDQSAQPGLAVGKLMKLTNMFPSIKEQMIISSFFTHIDNLIAYHQRELEEDQKKALMQLLLTGIVRVNR